MDIVLVSITGIALVLTVAMGMMVLRLLREERQRSDARVALLTAATATSSADALDLFDPEPQAAQRANTDVKSVNGLFAAPVAESPWKRRLAVAAGLAVLIVISGLALTSRTTGPQSAASQQTAQPSMPLELLALRHSQEPDTLTITGLVQNPRGGGAVSHVSAVAFLFGSDGALLASGRANLDYSTLEPGGESPFVIKVPVSGTVGRYRVGFRAADGSVIAHVDRRADGTAASNERGTGNVSWVR